MPFSLNKLRFPRQLVVVGSLALLFVLGFGLSLSKSSLSQHFKDWFNQNDTPQPVALQVKSGAIGYVRQKISAERGGELASDQVKVSLPAGFTQNDVVVSYRGLATQKLSAAHAVGGMFELTAKTVDGTQVSQFAQPLTISMPLTESQLEDTKTNSLSLYFFDESSKKWQPLESRFDDSTKSLIATTTHFTVFVAASGDPNQGLAESTASPFIVDDGDQEPAFTPGGLSDDEQPEFWEDVGSGYNGNARYTGNSINNTPHNWATWKVASGLTGEVEVTVTIPVVEGKNLTHGAKYKVTHAGGTTTVVVDQAAHAGGSASLGSFTFNGSGSVYLSDVVSEQGTYFASHIVFDAVSFGEELGQTDFTPPKISDVRAMSDNGWFRINAMVIDEGTGVAEVYLIMNGQAYLMKSMGGDRYAIDIPIPKNGKLNYSIVAYDVARNEGAWIPGLGQVTRGAYYRLTGYHAGMVRDVNSVCNTTFGCPPGATKRSQIVGHPVNTVNGNLIEEVKLVEVGGRPAFTFGLTYNNQAGRPSIFGENWTHSYNYHTLEVKTPLSNAVHVQYPDGKIVTFTGDDLQPEPGYFEKLARSGDGFVLTFKDLAQATFDADGDITRYQDANGNGLNFAYGTKQPHTLMSELTSITADGGRSLTFSYSDGLVSTITAPENKTLSFTYTDSDLTSWTNARGGVTSYTYDDHNLTQSTTPEGFVYMTNVYDSERRVIDHHVGEDFHTTFSYTDDQTTLADAHGRTLTYTYTDEELLNSIGNSAGQTVAYAFTDDKQVKTLTDEEGAATSYTYDAQGNVLTETDPLGHTITRTYDTTFNKPLAEVNKLADHTTAWTYDAQGNLLSETNAQGNTRAFTYNSFGQLVAQTNFRGHATQHTYSPAGDLATTTDSENNVTQFGYDGLGRLISQINPRNFTTTYTYDKNDNLTKLAGPTSYALNYVYDANDRLKTEVDANGGSTNYTYDHSNNLITKANQLGFTTSYEYGPMNELVKTTSPEGHITNYSYDDAYNVIALTEAAGTSDERTTHFTYNKRHDVISSTDALGRKTVFTYDDLQRLTKQVQNDQTKPLADGPDINLITSFEYSPTGALLKQTDPETNATTFAYDALDRLISTTDAESQTSSFTYDADSNQVTATNPRTFTTTHTYDTLGRLTKTTDAKGGETFYSYDPNSNLTAVKDANAITTGLVYNPLDRLEKRVQNFISGGPTNAQTNVTTAYTYDPHGNLTKLTNPRSFATTFTYDDAHRQIAITDALGNASHLVYDKEDNILTTTDRNNHSWQYVYDELNRQTTSKNPESHAQTLVYDLVDNITKMTNPRGKVWLHQYDGVNRLVTTTDPLTHTKKLDYDKVGNVLKLTDENNHVDQFSYDKIYRLLTSTDAENNQTSRQYDPNSNLVKLTDAEGNPTQYQYDELDRLIAQTNAEDETENYAYDKTTNVTLKTEADGTPHQFEYDPIYRLATVVNNFRDGQPAAADRNVATNYTYDANGNLVVSTDANNHATNFGFDPLDRLITETNPLGNTWQYSYDHEQNVTKRVDANGASTNYNYYPDDVLAQITYPSHNVAYTYSETNFPLTMADNLGTTTWQYDDLDRLTNQHDPLGRTLAYELDPVGNLTKLLYPDGRSVNHQYLKNDWLNQTKSSDNDAIAFTRNKVGAPIHIKHSNSSTSDIAYDKVYRQLQVFDQQQGSGNHLISKFNYTYNDVGHQTEEVAEYGWRQPAKVATTFGYDGLHRLSLAQSDDGQKSQYTYDAVGNRTTLIEQLQQGPETRNYAFNAANQLMQVAVTSPLPPNNLTTKFTYDQNGNRVDKLIADATGLDRGTDYSYDFENRLTKAQDYHYQLPASPEPTPTPSPTPSVSPSPSPTLAPSPTPTPSPCPGNGNGNGKNDGKDDSDDCNNGGGNDDKSGSLVAVASPSPTTSPVAPTPSTTPSPSPTSTPTLAPENTVTTQTPAVPTRNELANTIMDYDGNGRRLVSTYSPGNSQQLKRTEFLFDRLDPVAEYSMWNGQRNNLYRTTRNPITRPVQPANPNHSQFSLTSDNQGADLAFFQEFKSEQDPNGTIYWYHYDGEGNIAATTKHKGQSDHTYRYDEYGLTLPDNGTGLGQVGSQNNNGSSGWDAPHNQYTLTQKYADPNTALTYFGSRHYDPEMGVWLTQDSYRGQAAIPQSLHRYMYNGSTPINYQDAYGKCFTPFCLGELSLIAAIFYTSHAAAQPAYAPGLPEQPQNITQLVEQHQQWVNTPDPYDITGFKTINKSSGVLHNPGASNVDKIQAASGIGLHTAGNTIVLYGTSLQLASLAITCTTTVSNFSNIPKPGVSDPKLQNLVNDLYKGANTPNPIGSGSTADAIRNEILTGQPTYGTYHLQKGQEYVNALNNWILKNPNANPEDIANAQKLSNDLNNALQGK